MNAYELADEIDSIAFDWLGKTTSGKLANMLRQQADRIAELEKSAEPVAWIKKDTLIFLGNYEFGSITIQVQKQKDNEFDIPLYTTPQIKELSDEEIEELQAEHTEKGHFADTLNVKEFARAILKKASEK